jgi:hypothetical protein
MFPVARGVITVYFFTALIFALYSLANMVDNNTHVMREEKFHDSAAIHVLGIYLIL